MHRRYGQLLKVLFLLSDLLVTGSTWLAAYALRFRLLAAPRGVPEVEHVVEMLPLLLVLAVAAYRLCGLYQVHRLCSFAHQCWAICLASGLLFLLTIAATFYRRDIYESRLALGLFFTLNALGLCVTRLVGSWLLARSGWHRRTAIIGAGRRARRVLEVLRRNRWSGLVPVGFIDQPSRFMATDLPLLGNVDRLPQIVEQHRIDHVLIALPLSRYGELPAVYKALGQVLVEVQLVPDVPTLAGMRIRPSEVDGLSFLSLRENPHIGWHRVAKRGMDLVLGSLALVILSPLMLLLAVLVKLTSPGPVFYRQLRAGLGGSPFTMLKFRSMYTDAERHTGPVWARKDDDRCTPLGRFMRRWSLDELPQLFNVLAGHMSLVGPRPERGVFVEKFRHQIPNYTQRHQVKAGITGWAQVNGWRGRTSLRRRVECDLYYICNWSLWLDLRILWLTIWRGFRHRNAY